MIFYVRNYEYMMGSPGLIGFSQILKGLEAEGRPGPQAVLGACEGRLSTGTCQKVSMAVFWP